VGILLPCSSDFWCIPAGTDQYFLTWAFLTKLNLENEYLPFGERLSNYKLKGEESSLYLIYRINQDSFLNSKFIEWYSRLEVFLVFFLNAVSTINKEDPNWIIYLLYRQYQNNNDQTFYSPIGFITVYLYYSYPDKKRPRIR
jgi:histone acetyltransferase 1